MIEELYPIFRSISFGCVIFGIVMVVLTVFQGIFCIKYMNGFYPPKAPKMPEMPKLPEIK